MKQLLMSAVIAAVGATVFTISALAADVGVSVSVGQPGFYGQIDIGDFPRPQVIYSQPRMIVRGEGDRTPVYQRDAPSKDKKWRKNRGE